MTLFAMSPETAVPTLAILSVLYVLLTVFLLWLMRSLELRLIVLGLLTAVLAAWVAQMPAEGTANIQVGPAPAAAVGRVTLGGEAAGTLGRVAVLLVLGGLAAGLLGRWNYTAPPSSREDTRRDNPA